MVMDIPHGSEFQPTIVNTTMGTVLPDRLLRCWAQEAQTVGFHSMKNRQT